MSPLYARIPKIVHWRAREDRAEERPASVDENHTNEAVTRNPESRVGKDTEVLEQDRELGAGDGQIVHPNRCPEWFQRCDLIMLAQRVLMLPHPVFDLQYYRNRCRDGEKQSHKDEDVVNSGISHDTDPRSQA